MNAYFADLEWIVEFPTGPDDQPVATWPSTYREAGLLVPCCRAPTRLRRGIPEAQATLHSRGYFCPLAYLDSLDAIITGREIMGFPKRHAEITVAPAAMPHAGTWKSSPVAGG